MRWPELAAVLRRDRKAALGLAIVGGFVVLALFGPHWVGDPAAIVDIPRLPPSSGHWFGTNGQGQDVLAQAIAGGRITLLVAFAVGLLVTAVGAVVGVSAAYFGGRVDDCLSILTNVFLVIPGLPLAIVLAAYLPAGPVSIAAVLVLSGWAWNARTFRAQALTLRRRDFVAAAVVAGESHAAIICREIIPNMISLIVSAFIGATIYAIAAQVGLEFLGLGDVGEVTWGTNLYWAANNAALITGTWWEFLPTGVSVALVGFGLALINFGIDAVTNPRLRLQPRALSPRPAAAPTDVRGEPVLALRDLRVCYAGCSRPAVSSMSLTINPGEFVGLAGESGCGKTTVGYSILRLLPEGTEVGGHVYVDGSDVLRLSAERLRRLRWRRASMVFQSALNALNPVLTVREQLVDTLLAHQQMMGSDQAEARAHELLTLVELSASCIDAYPHQLSGGMRQRVVIAMALALRPRLLIMDEPTTALDVVVQKQILERVIALQKRFGFAVLFISHDLPLLFAVADRIAVMKDGELVEVGAREQMRDAARHPYSRQLIATCNGLRQPGAAVMPGATRLALHGVGKEYRRQGVRQPVLHDVSFEVAEGELVALVGQSGSGKSTVARLVAGLERADTGTISLMSGKTMESSTPATSRAQMIFQDPFASLNPVHRVGYHLERPLRCAGIGANESRDRVQSALGLVGLQPARQFVDRYPHELSGGQRQRVAVARALVVDPEIIVADEPTSMLDASIRADLLGLLRRLTRQRGVAVLLITHDLASAVRWADRVVVLHEGSIVESGRATTVFTRPRNPYTALLVEAAKFTRMAKMATEGTVA